MNAITSVSDSTGPDYDVNSPVTDSKKETLTQTDLRDGVDLLVHDAEEIMDIYADTDDYNLTKYESTPTGVIAKQEKRDVQSSRTHKNRRRHIRYRESRAQDRAD